MPSRIVTSTHKLPRIARADSFDRDAGDEEEQDDSQYKFGVERQRAEED